jgi:Xaa-Pro aminopeptidase
LLDVGAEYANYSSDMTRISVSGRLLTEKEVYNAVLRVKNEATTKMLVPGTLD